MRFRYLKKALSIVGACGLLLSALALVGTPASAATTAFTAINRGDDPLDVVADSACSKEEATVAADSQSVLSLDTACNYTVTVTDAAGLCTVEGRESSEDGWSTSGYQVAVSVDDGGADPDRWRFRTTGDCLVPTAVIEIDKDVESEVDEYAAAQTTFTFSVTPWDLTNSKALADGGACSDQSTQSGQGGTDGAGSIAQVTVVNGFIAANAIAYCSYAVTESVPKGWTLIEVDADEECDESEDTDEIKRSIELLAEATVILTPTFVGGDEDDECEAEFVNDLNPLPLSVTKTFVGRDFYTTVDRADFHLFTPGFCGSFAIDPFGGLIGSEGVYRTINASQLSQVVIALLDAPAAGPNGVCTYRIQENGMPEGCTALDPEGSDADGPYWEQTWVPGETTNFVFNIVNDCSRPEPTPDPDSDHLLPGGKKPGGDLNPKFTG